MPVVSTVARWQEIEPDVVAGRTVAVIDVLRWSTVVLAALESGAERVESFATPEEALARAEDLGRDQVLLGGERGNRALPGFDVGNSPLEYTRERCARRVVVTTTTNGTQALLATAGAHDVVIAAFRNLEAVSDYLQRALRAGRDVVLVAAGQAGAEALEDLACAGAIAERLGSAAGSPDADTTTARAMALWRAAGRDTSEVMARAPHAAALRGGGFADDVGFCAGRDASRLVPVIGPRGCVPNPDQER